MMQYPQASLNSVTPGRARLRIQERKGDVAFFTEVSRRLSEVSEIDEVRVNPRTGSVLLHYRGSLENVGNAGLKQHLFELEPNGKRASRPAHESLAGGIEAAGETLDRLVTRGSSGFINLRTLGVMALTGFAIYQLRRGKFLPAALPMGLEALRLLRRQ